MGKPRPRNGPAKPASGGGAGPLKKFKKPKGQQQQQQQQGAQPQDDGTSGGNGGGKRRKQRAPWWSFVGLVAGLAGLYLYVTGVQRKEKRQRDRRVLDGMRRRPLKVTEHAACRMECR